MQFHEMNTSQGVDHILSQLDKNDIDYAINPDRGEFRGFAALHDLMDANMLLPFVNTVDIDEKYISFCNDVMEKFNEYTLDDTN